MKWAPKADKIGIAGKGLIPAADFSKEDLKLLIDRANNRKIPVDLFLSNFLRPDPDGIDDSDLKEESEIDAEIKREEAAAPTKKDRNKKVKEDGEEGAV